MQRKITKLTAAAVVAGLAATAVVAAPAIAHGPGGGWSQGGAGIMGPGYGQGMMGHMGPGMMGPGYGAGMMGHMAPGTMGYGYGPGARGLGPQGFGDCPAAQATAGKDLSVGDVSAFLERRLTWQGNPRLKLGDVREQGDDAIVAEIVTTDGSLVEKLLFDRHTGQVTRSE